MIKIHTLMDENLALFAVGLVVFIAGLVIRFVAIVTLGKNFSGRLRLRDDHTLVKTGIYGWVRHPRVFGFVPNLPELPDYATQHSRVSDHVPSRALLPAPDQARGEDTHRTFRAEYEEYMRHSKRLIPFLY